MLTLKMSLAEDPHNLARFVEAQENTWEQAIAELKRGRKSSHWMWFIFPQIRGLGSSETARFYAIQSGEEARAFLAHPILGQRLLESCRVLLAHEDRTAHEIFGSPDEMKLRSSMTLFAAVSGGLTEFEKVIEKYYSGGADSRTLELLKAYP